jgi:Ser-tRNA(Ala) deacylase AlaX
MNRENYDFEIYETIKETHMVCLLVNAKTISLEEAVRDMKWKAIMDEDIKTIKKNKIWKITELPKWHKSIGVKWVYNKKMTS